MFNMFNDLDSIAYNYSAWRYIFSHHGIEPLIKYFSCRFVVYDIDYYQIILILL